MLKPGGRFYVEEILKKYIVHPLLRRILAHHQEDRFDHACFAEELQQIGFKIIDTEGFMQLYGCFIADKPATLNFRNNSRISVIAHPVVLKTVTSGQYEVILHPPSALRIYL